MSEKVKTGICNRPDKVIVLILQFLRLKKQKHGNTIGLTSCWYNCLRIIMFTIGKAKTNTYDRPDQLLA